MSSNYQKYLRASAMGEPHPGAAGILVELRNSRITVKHSQNGEVLAEGRVSMGAWDRIWDAIRDEFV